MFKLFTCFEYLNEHFVCFYLFKIIKIDADASIMTKPDPVDRFRSTVPYTQFRAELIFVFFYFMVFYAIFFFFILKFSL